MKPSIEVIYGALGSGKSTHASRLIDVRRTFKLGVGGWFQEAITLSFGSGARHEKANRDIGLRFRRVTLRSIAAAIGDVRDPVLLIDEWTALPNYAWCWREARIRAFIDQLLDAISRNEHLERVLLVCVDQQRYLPFGLYKKKALWNTRLFAAADRITRLEFGVPIVIKEATSR